MFERFTDRARRVVVLADEEARTLNHNYIGTEHLVLGLLREEEGVAARALTASDISLEGARKKVEETVGRGQEAPTGHIPYMPRAKKVLELALRESLQLGHHYIGTEHLLLGLIREGAGIGAQVLTALDVDLNQVRQRVLQLLQDQMAKAKEPELSATTLSNMLPEYSVDCCPKCPSVVVDTRYVGLHIRYSETLGLSSSDGEYLRRECRTCGYSWREQCRTNLMAPKGTWTAEQYLSHWVSHPVDWTS